MYEHSTLQEAYTGALIAGKGKTLNNINVIMDRTRFPREEWVRVRFGAGVPWRRCWCVISPPDEKEYQKLQKELKKRSPYDRSAVPILKGDIKFYDTKKDGKKQKKARPIASISDAYSAYALYPQAKSLIDASTLLKIEGNITIHSDPPSSTEGFVFVMPETHPMVSGFEMLLRYVFPTWDSFGLYGRPGRLVASVLDTRSLMFAMPKHRRYGYLEILDVTGLILTEGSSTWSEREWRKRLKDLTSRRMNAVEDGGSRMHSRSNSRKSTRLSFGPGMNGGGSAKPKVNFADDGSSVRSGRSMASNKPGARNDSAPPTERERFVPAMASIASNHARNSSDPQLIGHGHNRQDGYDSPYSNSPQRGPTPVMGVLHEHVGSSERLSSEDERPARSTPVRELEGGMRDLQTPEPVSRPPAFNHHPQARPTGKTAYHSPELRQANNRLSSNTLSQLAKAGGVPIPTDSLSDASSSRRSAEETFESGPPVPTYATKPAGTIANHNGSREALSAQAPPLLASPGLPPQNTTLGQQRPKSPLAQGQSFGPQGFQPQHGPSPNDQGRPRSPERRNPMFQQSPPVSPPSKPQQPQQVPYNNAYRSELPRSPPAAPDHRLQNSVADARPGLPQNRSSFDRSHQQGYGPPATLMGSPIALPQIDTSNPSHRKPLPQRTTSLQKHDEPETQTPQSLSSAGSFGNKLIDQAGLDQVRPQGPGASYTPRPEQQVRRQDSERSGTSSRYDDASSTASPDYASTRKSSETTESFDRPRAGVLKTVGGGELPVIKAPQDTGYTVPEVNFGPTINYGASGNPRSKTPTPLNSAQINQRPHSPPRKSPIPELGHARQGSEDTLRRSVLWQPGSATAGTHNGGASQAVSAEQFVQQRAAAAAVPIYSHSRTPSGNLLTGMRPTTPTPSLPCSPSHEVLNPKHSRSNSVDLLQRPSSRGAGMTLGFGSGSGEMSSHLSAREQEHVARVTGSPLIQMAGNKNQNATAGGGLVGAIHAREREKLQMKQGYNNQAVQHAINQRQQQQAQQQVQQAQQQMHAQAMAYQHQLQQQMYAQQNMSQQSLYTTSGAGRGNQQFVMRPQQQQQQQQSPYGPPPNFVSPMAGMYAQGSGYPRAPTMQQGQQPPQQHFISPPQGQQSPGPQQGGRGQAFQQHQGQAF
jgi:CCR4-NOT transcriptional complex subunit CAF120